MPTLNKRPASFGIGRASERRAAAYLLSLGYEIVGVNIRLKIGELDIVAWDGDVLVFAEVRSRFDQGKFGGALCALSRTKQRQVSRVAALYLALQFGGHPPHCRFDALAVDGAKITHIPDAWRS